MVQLALFADAPRWPDGLYKLSDAIHSLRPFLLRDRPGHVRQTGALSDLLCRRGRLGTGDCLEPSLAEVFPFWAMRMAVAEPDLLEATADEAGTGKISYSSD